MTTNNKKPMIKEKRNFCATVIIFIAGCGFFHYLLRMSSYGYFDDDAEEYVITNPDTPLPWMNYSGNRTYGGLFSHHSSGYSFSHSPATGRLLRYSYTAPPCSQPGRYLYLLDNQDGDFWSSSWMPVAKPLDQFHTTCRMGMGTTEINSTYKGIQTTSTYFIPLDQEFEYWFFKISNESNTVKNLTLFTYAEFNSVWDILHEEFNQQYANAITQCQWENGMVSGRNMPNLPILNSFGERHQSRWWHMMQAGDAKVESWDLERTSFLGSNGGYASPHAVRNGACSKSTAYGDIACGAIQSHVQLEPGETSEIVILVGPGQAVTVGEKNRQEYGCTIRAKEELEKLKRHWKKRTRHLKVETPDPEFNSMINVWGTYNAMMTFEWSRSCSSVYTGQDRDGYGFRDTIQDVLGVLPSISDEVGDRLRLMLSGQESSGGAQPVVDPVFFQPGAMPKTDLREQRADDCLWLFNSIPAFVAETGNHDFYHEIIPFADHGEDTVYGHLKRALKFSLTHRGEHGLACGLKADWNDCIILGERGESVFVSFQLRLALDVFTSIATVLHEYDDAEWAKTNLAALDQSLQEHTWDGNWFIRAITENGTIFGSEKSPEGQIFLNTQSWAIMSGTASADQAEQCMASVEKKLATRYGLKLHDSSFSRTDRSLMHAVVYLPGAKENGGIFQHTQGWAVIADCMIGQADRAYKNFRSYLPSAQNDEADIREVEPYVYAQWTHAPNSPKHGRSRVPWLSGTAAWSYFAATHFILGLRPEPGGLRIDPAMPSSWDYATVTRIFHGKTLHIQMENPEMEEGKVSYLQLDSGEILEGSLLPLSLIRDGMKIMARIEANERCARV